MIGSLIVLVVLFTGLASALRHSSRADIISTRPYNNPYSDASAARENWLG